MLASTHFTENESTYRFKLLDHMDEAAGQNAGKIALYIADVYKFEQSELKQAMSKGKRLTRQQEALSKKGQQKDTTAAAVDSKVADVTLSSQSSSSSTSSSTAYNELVLEVAKLQDQVTKLNTSKGNLAANRDVRYKF